MALSVKVIGTQQVVARLRSRPARVGQALMRAVQAQAIRVQARVKDVKLVGGSPLHSRTGKLRRSVHVTESYGDGLVTGFVGTNVRYAAVHELGLTVTVREHLRMMTMAFGRSVKNPRKINVKAHEVRYPERSFLRSSLKELAPSVKEELLSSVNEALRMPS